MAGGIRVRGGDALAQTVQALYAAGQSDYSLEPMVLVSERGEPVGRIRDGDAVVFCCRRGEREVQLTEAFTAADFPHFPQADLRHLDFVILTLYHEKFKDLPVAFAPARIPNTLGEQAGRAGLRQARIAESEKFAHVTFFFNGGNNQRFPGEDDFCIPSPKGIPFERLPELSLAAVAGQVCAAIDQRYPLIVANFANGDVIGHTASREAKLRCAEAVDRHLGGTLEAARAAGYVVLVTADHGNLETLFKPDGSPHMAHTENPVPLILIDPQRSAAVPLRAGCLADVAPTVLEILGCPPPEGMTGQTLAPGVEWGAGRRVLLIILDGWGLGRRDDSNPIFIASTPVWDALPVGAGWPSLQAAGEAVGLQAGKPGNSEAGHMNIGAGRVVLQDDVRLDRAMQDGSFYTNEILNQTIAAALQRRARLHLIGLLSEKSSHGSIEYPLAIAQMARRAGLQDVYLHVIFDGRSTEPGSAPRLLANLDDRLEALGVGQVVSGIGRGIALDRDGNYAKTRRAYEALTLGSGRACSAAPIATGGI